MNRAELLEIFTREQRIEIDYPNVLREVDGPVIRHISLSDEDGFVIYSDLEEQDVELAIERQIARFREAGQSFEWKVYDYDRPSDLAQRLAAHGFQIEEAEALLVLDLAEGPPLLSILVPGEIHKVTDPAGVAGLMAVEQEVWGEDYSELGGRLRGDLERDPEEISLYAAHAGGRAVSAAWMYFHPGTHFASLWGGSTLPAHRGRGLYTALLAVRAQEAWGRGFRFLTVDASPMSRPILEKHGFQLLTFSRPCIWKYQK